MMHERGKSDSVIVAVKPANKADHSAAEPMEPRTGTKGNADLLSTCRAQDRESVSQALDRIRQVARLRKKERFTALFHHISTELLETAFYELKQDAAPGVDGVKQARGDHEGASTAHASANPFSGEMAEASRHRLLSIPRSAYE
jgi:RNA-directed DNA polymerase